MAMAALSADNSHMFVWVALLVSIIPFVYAGVAGGGCIVGRIASRNVIAIDSAAVDRVTAVNRVTTMDRMVSADRALTNRMVVRMRSSNRMLV